MIALATGCDGCKSSPAAAANAKAASMKKDAIAPRLTQLKADRPELAAEVDKVLAQWGTVPERQTCDGCYELMAQYAHDHPDQADDVNRVMQSWRRRLDNFSPTTQSG